METLIIRKFMLEYHVSWLPGNGSFLAAALSTANMAPDSYLQCYTAACK